MTTMNLHHDRLRPLASAHLLALALLVCVVMIQISLQLSGVDDRQLNGVGVWLKPLKFALALGLQAATLIWIFGQLPEPVARGRTVRCVGAAVGITILYEVMFITIQAARGVRSHFNDTTAFDAIGGSIMAAGAGVLTLGPAIVGVVVLWHLLRHRRRTAHLPLHMAMALGLILSGWLGGQTGGAIGANQGPLVGAAVGPYLPLVGWSMTGGDLRIAHFIGLHAMQALPVAGLVAVRFLRPGPALFANGVFAILWIALALWSLAAAQNGMPPI